MGKWSKAITGRVDAHSWQVVSTFFLVIISQPLHILDQRNIPALGRIGDPDDIIGSVFVEKSKVFT